jgi:chemotaxis protein CheD
MNDQVVSVGIGEYKVAQSPLVLRTILGSCVAVILYDKINRIGGLAHVYLPTGEDYKSGRESTITSHKFADILLPLMVEEILKKNGNKRYFSGYLVGGASLFDAKPSSFLDIGRKNLEAVRLILGRMRINFFELEVGGNKGRKVFFNLKNGDIEVINLNGMKKKA